MPLIIATLPILLTISLSYLAATLNVLPRERWNDINTLSFQILIPAILIHSIAGSDLSGISDSKWIAAILLSLLIVTLLVLSLRLIIPHTALANSSFSTLFQTTTRWNAFISLVAADQLIGAEGIALLAIAMAVMIPVINVVNIAIMAIYGTAKPSLMMVLQTLLKNPLIIACLIGLLISLSDINVPEPIMQTLELIGRAALGIGLLAVGARITLARLLRTSWKIWLALCLRPFLCPLVFLGFAWFWQLSLTEAIVGILIFAVPAAANGYIVAQKMGGDDELYADILTWQTILSLLALPLFALLAQQMV